MPTNEPTTEELRTQVLSFLNTGKATDNEQVKRQLWALTTNEPKMILDWINKPGRTKQHLRQLAGPFSQSEGGYQSAENIAWDWTTKLLHQQPAAPANHYQEFRYAYRTFDPIWRAITNALINKKQTWVQQPWFNNLQPEQRAEIATRVWETNIGKRQLRHNLASLITRLHKRTAEACPEIMPWVAEFLRQHGKRWEKHMLRHRNNKLKRDQLKAAFKTVYSEHLEPTGFHLSTASIVFLA